MRVFIAIEFDEETKKYLGERQKFIQEYSLKGNFTHEENFHITLKFIGDVNQNEVKILKKAIDAVSDNHRSFTLFLEKIGQFPRGKKSILWIGLMKNKDLEVLQKDLEEILNEKGYPKEDRPYRPHITLARELILKDDYKKLERNIDIEPKKIQVSKISLMESTRINGQLKYIPIYCSDFKNI